VIHAWFGFCTLVRGAFGTSLSDQDGLRSARRRGSAGKVATRNVLREAEDLRSWMTDSSAIQSLERCYCSNSLKIVPAQTARRCLPRDQSLVAKVCLQSCGAEVPPKAARIKAAPAKDSEVLAKTDKGGSWRGLCWAEYLPRCLSIARLAAVAPNHTCAELR